MRCERRFAENQKMRRKKNTASRLTFTQCEWSNDIKRKTSLIMNFEKPWTSNSKIISSRFGFAFCSHIEQKSEKYASHAIFGSTTMIFLMTIARSACGVPFKTENISDRRSTSSEQKVTTSRYRLQSWGEKRNCRNRRCRKNPTRLWSVSQLRRLLNLASNRWTRFNRQHWWFRIWRFNREAICLKS